MSEWLAMGGYGAYVWGAYAATALVLLWDATAPLRARRQFRRRHPRRPARSDPPPP
jgi:heme exporter protein D